MAAGCEREPAHFGIGIDQYTAIVVNADIIF
jgi:cyanophycinase-like exopeptidase